MSECHSFSHGPLLHRTFEQLSLGGAPEQGTRALIVDRSLCLRNNATVAEISPLGGDNYITEEKLPCDTLSIRLPQGWSLSHVSLVRSLSSRVHKRGIWTVRACAARSDIEVGFSSSNNTTFPSLEWTKRRNAIPFH